jgi:hypothetical protein
MAKRQTYFQLRHRYLEHMKAWGIPSSPVLIHRFKTFWDTLSEEQRCQYSKNYTITIIGGSTGRKYVMNCGGSYVGNVTVQHGGVSMTSMCAHPRSVGDAETLVAFVAQKFAIEHNEAYWLKTAIQSGPPIPKTV